MVLTKKYGSFLAISKEDGEKWKQCHKVWPRLVFWSPEVGAIGLVKKYIMHVIHVLVGVTRCLSDFFVG